MYITAHLRDKVYRTFDNPDYILRIIEKTNHQSRTNHDWVIIELSRKVIFYDERNPYRRDRGITTNKIVVPVGHDQNARTCFAPRHEQLEEHSLQAHGRKVFKYKVVTK
jgi:hypothetical protein